ncbi:alginate lyase family protein [candidate division KSB1 bacterium]|nr:alginate lyase family protein [candidate division KSB1 bacterium]MBL7093197.1 alginate lyase family protein [candidate division KSB1 bacterium]
MRIKDGLKKLIAYLVIFCVLFCYINTNIAKETNGINVPRIFLLDLEMLTKVKQRILEGDKKLLPAFNKISDEANISLKAGSFSVMTKPFTPPSGDKHDYMSLSPYWWSNPETEDGLPYVRHDGRTNPKREQYDKRPLRELDLNVSTLALAYFLTDNENYAEHAAKLVRNWFLNKATRMNPHLKYAQHIPGISDGRGVGIIDTRSFFRIADGVGLISESNYWTEQDQKELEEWFAQYLKWLLHSKNGQKEAARDNNHGTWYDVQVAYFSLYTGKEEKAKEVLRKFKMKRIADQIEPDGRQPRELERTRAFSYSTFNLEAMFAAAKLGDIVGVDIWDFETEDGRSIQKALEFLIPYAIQKKEWQYQQITSWQGCYFDMSVLLRMASIYFEEPKYEQLITVLPDLDIITERVNLLYPKIW